MTVLYIIGGIFVFMVLLKIGFYAELFAMAGVCLMIGGIGALIGWLAADAGFSGFVIGVIVGVSIYALYCIGRIINPTIDISIFEDGSTETVSERGRGIVGLIVLILAILAIIFK